MMVIEVLGFVAGAVSVWLYVRQNVWAWPVGIANSVCWAVLFWGSRLYLDAGLQLVFVAVGLWGWYWWLHGGTARNDLPVRRTRRTEAAALGAVGAVSIAVLWWAMTRQDDAAPFWDALTTVVSLIAQYMLGRKMLGTWWCWITVDLVYIGVYSSQHLYLTAALQPLFIAMCVLGWRQWRASLAAAPTAARPAAAGPTTPNPAAPNEPAAATDPAVAR